MKIVTDELTGLLDRFGSALAHAVSEELEVDAGVERVEVRGETPRTTLTVVVSWDPDAEEPVDA